MGFFYYASRAFNSYDSRLVITDSTVTANTFQRKEENVRENEDHMRFSTRIPPAREKRE